jgi:hypothetical protein
MGKLTLDLNKFKASGIYTVEFDASESVTISTQTIRLVVGFSRKGPFNAPVFLRDVKSARKIFGEIDTVLEKKGSFFHRSLETCLQTGPVFALNLLALNNTPEGDKIDYRSFSLSIAENNCDTTRELMASFYNKERFWFPDSSYFQAIVDNDPLNSEKLMSFTNLGQKPISVIVRKSKNIKGFDLTARDFYGSGNVPEYIRDFDFISDYFVDVLVVEGDWTNYSNLSIDPLYSKFFDKNGVKSDKVDNFIADDSVTLVANITGCIIPEFTDKNGVNQFIETLINNTVGTTGIFMTMNKAAFDDYENSTYKVDMIGHSLVDSTKDSMNFLSYVSPITDELYFGSYAAFSDELKSKEYNAADFNAYSMFVKSLPYTNNSSPFFNTLVIPKPKPLFSTQKFTLTHYNELLSKITENSLITSNSYDPLNIDLTSFLKVDSLTNTGVSLEMVLSNPDKNTTTAGVYNDEVTISDADDATNAVTLTFAGDKPATISQYDTIYVKGLNKYYVIDTAVESAPGSGIWDVTLFVKIEDMTVPSGLFYDSWLPETTLSNPEPMRIVETDMNLRAASFCLVNDHLNYMANILDTVGSPVTGYKLEYIESPSLLQQSGTLIYVYPGNKLFTDIKNKSIIDGDYVSLTNAFNSFNYLSFATVTGDYGLSCYKITQWSNSDLTSVPTSFVEIDNYTDVSYTRTGYATKPADADFMALITTMDIADRDYFIAIESGANKIEQMIPVISDSINATKTKFRIASANALDIEVGQYIVVDDLNDPRLTRVIQKIKKTNANTGFVEYEISVNEPIKINEIGTPAVKYVDRFLPIPQIANTLQFTALSGFTITTYHTPGTTSQLWKILNVIENTNLGDTLKDKEIISFRYIVDTFGGGLEPMCGPKVILSRLAKNRQKCMALINAPSIAEFIASTDPRFTDEPTPETGNPKPVLKSEYIATGGNLTLGPSFRYSLPDEENGAKFCGVFTPFLKMRENNKDKLVPPAADVSNNFIRKFTSGQPYSIAAGPRRGVISNPKLVGLEYEFLTADREYIEPFGLNPIITTRKTGPMIYGNQTAYQKTLTAFNNLHVRDLLITIEDAIEDVLANYVFEYNDPRTRLEIRTIVDGYLQTVKNSGGIYDYMVIMDESNNTNEIIDQNIGIIDVGVEPARGLQKVINRITVLKTGSIASGGFTIS